MRLGQPSEPNFEYVSLSIVSKYIWQQSVEHKEREKPTVDHLYPIYLCVITLSFLLVYLNIWAGMHGKGAGINL